MPAAAARRGSVRRGVAYGGVLAMAGVAGAVWLVPGRSPADPAAPVAPPTAAVMRRTLVSRTDVDATLGYGGRYTVVNQARGMVTSLPGAGRTVREGRALYRVDGRPVLLLYGRVTAYRTLSYGMTGPDVAALNGALRRLGYGGGSSRVFGSATAAALERLQARRGLPVTGTLPLGQAVFRPGAVRVTGWKGTQPGMPARPGTPVLAATSTEPVVRVALDVSRRDEVAEDDRVTVTLPSGRETSGTVSSIGRVATRSGDGPATVGVRVRLAAADGLDRAPVRVSIVTGRARDTLVVPVGALMARSGGRYAVEVAGRRGRYLLAVRTGLFDDADGLVQVSGRGLAPGLRVVVPAT